MSIGINGSVPHEIWNRYAPSKLPACQYMLSGICRWIFLGRAKARAPISCFFCPSVHLFVCHNKLIERRRSGFCSAIHPLCDFFTHNMVLRIPRRTSGAQGFYFLTSIYQVTYSRAQIIFNIFLVFWIL